MLPINIIFSSVFIFDGTVLSSLANKTETIKMWYLRIYGILVIQKSVRHLFVSGLSALLKGQTETLMYIPSLLLFFVFVKFRYLCKFWHSDTFGDMHLVLQEPSIEIYTQDITDWNKTRELIKQIGLVDMLVNNAAVDTPKPILEITEENYD